LPRAVLFDHDGVLVASERLHWRAWEKMLGEIGIPYPRELVEGMAGKTAPVILTRVLDLYEPGWSTEKYDLAALALRKNDIYLKVAETELEPYPGVREGLKWLKSQGIRIAVVSNSKRRELETALVHLKLIEYFDEVVSRDDVKPNKPDPAPYLHAAAALGFSADECVAVEDSPTGIEAALVGKVPAAAILTNFPEATMMQPVPGRPDLKPKWICKSIAEFFTRLRELPKA
jgi:beta-phosphoglucomutase